MGHVQHEGAKRDMSTHQAIPRDTSGSKTRGIRRPPRLFALGGLLLGAAPLLMGADRGCISSHPADVIVTQKTQNIEVKLTQDGTVDGTVELFLDGVSKGVGQTSGGKYTYPNVELSLGTHELTGKTSQVVNGQTVDGEIARQAIHYKDDLWDSGGQEVMFYWGPVGQQRLREIAKASLQGPLSEADLQRFVAGVKDRTRARFIELYSPYNVVLVDQPSSDSSGVVTVVFEDADVMLTALGTNIAAPVWDPNNIARSIPDYNNLEKTQTVRVFIGAVKKYLIDEEGGNLLNKTAARKTDSLDLRIRDISVALGDIAVHEVGHTLGLVAERDIAVSVAQQLLNDPDFPPEVARQIADYFFIPRDLPDLGGCRAGHSCPNTDAPGSDHFDSGYYIMDPGELTSAASLIGLTDDKTTRVEKLAKWDNFCASYLSIVVPKH